MQRHLYTTIASITLARHLHRRHMVVPVFGVDLSGSMAPRDRWVADISATDCVLRKMKRKKHRHLVVGSIMPFVDRIALKASSRPPIVFSDLFKSMTDIL